MKKPQNIPPIETLGDESLDGIGVTIPGIAVLTGREHAAYLKTGTLPETFALPQPEPKPSAPLDDDDKPNPALLAALIADQEERREGRRLRELKGYEDE